MKTFLRFLRYLKNYIKPLSLANIFMVLFVLSSVVSISLIMPLIDLLFRENTQNLPPVESISIFNLKDYMTYKLAEFSSQFGKIELLGYI